MKKTLVLLLTFLLSCCATAAPASKQVEQEPADPVPPPAEPFKLLPSNEEPQVHQIKRVTVNVEGSIDDDLADDVVKKINAFDQDESVDEIWVRLDTLGGNLLSGYRIMDAIERSPKPTVCVADHIAASMGFVLLQTCNKRMMTKRTLLAAHETQAEAKGNPHEIIRTGKEMLIWNRTIAEFVAKRLNLPVKVYLSKICDKEWDMDWEDALKNNAVDKDGILEDPMSIPNWESQQQQNIFKFLFAH